MSRALAKIARILVIFGAWLFAVVTLVQVLGYFIWSWFAPLTHRYCHLWALNLGGRLYEPLGLTYRGSAGQLLAGGQAAFVIASLVLSLRSKAALRRLGHLGLIAWASLWLANEIWFFALEPLTVTAARLTMLTVLWACTVLRAILNWTPTDSGVERLSAG